MEILNPEDLAIFKFEPNNIIMIHKDTKTLYQYFQTPILTIKQKNVFHDHLLQASFIPTGILYKKGITSMQSETYKRIKMANKQFYEEQEIVNTFLPVLQCLQYLHSKDISHGSLSPENIIFNEEDEVLLRDWFLQLPDNKYYETSRIKDRNQHDDIAAMGNILLEASTLIQLRSEIKNTASIESSLRKIMQRYSRGLILAIYVMLRKIDKFYAHLQKIMKNNESYIDSSEQLISLYKRIKGQKQFKAVINPTLLNHSNYKYIDLICKTPLTTKKVGKFQDLQNKKTYVEETKKKNNQRVHRIADKNSNYQTVKKPDMALKRMSNIKFNTGQESDKSYKKTSKQDVLKFGSPLKRLRTLSKKKAF